MEEHIEKFPTVPLFHGLEAQEIARILRDAEDVPTEPGQVIIEQGKSGEGRYVIGAGVFEVVHAADGAESVLARLEELSFFGEMSLFDQSSAAATVICREPGRLKRFSGSVFHGLLDRNDMVALRMTYNIAGMLARRLAKVDDRLVS